MAESNLEQRVTELEKELKKAKHEIERLQAIREIENLMSQYVYLHMENRQQDVMKLYAKHPDTRVYLGELGCWKGPDAPQRAWQLLERLGAGKTPPGMMAIHPVNTSYIVVAGDGKTAKGVWLNTGFVLSWNPEKQEQGARWEWGAYGIDFIKEDGKWKFWHHHIYRIASTDWAAGFKDWDPDRQVMKVPEDIKPDYPGMDDYPYRRDKVYVFKPDRAEPYETWSDTFSY